MPQMELKPTFLLKGSKNIVVVGYTWKEIVQVAEYDQITIY